MKSTRTDRHGHTFARRPRMRGLCALLFGLLVPASFVAAKDSYVAGQQPMVGVGIEEKLGQSIPADLTFTDHEGRTVQLADYLAGGRPVVLNLVYYGCPGLCIATQNGLATMLNQMRWAPGENYHVLSASFNPEEGPALAATQRSAYLQIVGRPGAEEGWTFLTGDEPNIRKLTEAAGFRYTYSAQTQEFAHDAAFIILTPEGQISRYLRGGYADPDTFRLALVEASDGRIGSISDQIRVRLCGFDPSQGKYVMMARTIVMIGGAATIGTLALVIGFLVYLERKNRAKASLGDVQPHTA